MHHEQPTTVLLIAAFDSQLKWCSRIRQEFERRGHPCRVVVPDIRSALSPGQVAEAGFRGVERRTWADTVALAAGSDVVVSGLAGPGTKQLSGALAAAAADGTLPRPPVLVSGWVGIIIEKITAGYLDRCGTDVVAVNSRADLAHFRTAAELLELPADNLLLTGLPFLSPRAAAPRGGPVRRVLFADQPTVPSSATDRRFLYGRLIDYAQAHPDRTVLLKPRHRPGEDTFHRMRHHPEDVLRGVPRPDNFRIDYTPIAEVVPDVDLLITMSSTACLEAIDAGSRVALVLDLGVHERYGNHVFLDSGLLRTFAQIGRDELGAPQPEWQAGYFPELHRTATETLVDRAEELLRTGCRPAAAVWASDYFTSSMAFERARAAASETAAAQRASSALRRRMHKHGNVAGLVAHAAVGLLPPVLSKPAANTAARLRLLKRH